MKNLSTKNKLMLGFGVSVILIGLVGYIALVKLKEINSIGYTMYTRELVGLRHISESNTQNRAAMASIRGAILAETVQDRLDFMKSLERQRERAHKEFGLAVEKFDGDDFKLTVEARKSMGDYDAAMDQLLEILNQESPGQVSESTKFLMTVLRPVANNLAAKLEGMIEHKNNDADLLRQTSEDAYENAEYMVEMLVVFASIVALSCGVAIVRSISNSLGGEPKDVALVAGAIAHGDLRSHIEISRAMQGSIVLAIAKMQDSLITTVAAVRGASEGIYAITKEIASANEDLAQRTESQASNLEQTAAALEELLAGVKANAEISGETVGLARIASDVALRGEEVVGKVVEKMESIKLSSARISEIISVIDGIAFQTNILALNAAVEAARAGEQGRGFAVVATEVRSLAQKSSEAAKNIKLLIEGSTEVVNSGGELVNEAGIAMQDVVARIKQVEGKMSQIDVATQQQTLSIEQINNAIAQLDQTTQKNAALVEESAAISESLKQQAEQLVGTVSVFRLGAGQARDA